jgi:stress response protein YsnF
MIIPLLEEVLVVEKRLVLREEVHVKRVQHEVQESKSVLLRTEQVDITRRPGGRSDDSPGSKHGAA